MVIAILCVSLLVTGLLVGSELAVAMFIHPVLYTVPDQAHAPVAKPLAKRLGHDMPFWYAASLVLALIQLLVTPHATNMAWWLGCIAVIIMAAIIVLTILLPVPINNKIATWDLNRLPSDWKSMRQRWDFYHRVRVFLLVAAFALLILSALL